MMCTFLRNMFLSVSLVNFFNITTNKTFTLFSGTAYSVVLNV